MRAADVSERDGDGRRGRSPPGRWCAPRRPYDDRTAVPLPRRRRPLPGAGEVYDLSYEQLREVLLPGEPDGLELGVVELADGSGSLAMVLRRPYPNDTTPKLPPLTDISELGSWRAYRAAGSPAGTTTADRAGEQR
jgi:hypothetical protein